MPYKDSDKQREYQRLRLAARRAKFLTDKSCVSCGVRDQLQLDHVDAATKSSHRIWSWSEERFGNEVSKCQILCRDCHKTKTNLAGENGWKPAVCGTVHSYEKGCRCSECRAAVAAKKRAQRARAQKA